MQMQPALDDLKIDPEFESKIPQLTKEEFELLEKNIVEDGRVTDRLVVWNNTILDGHNRYRILKKHPEIPFEVVNMTFPDKYTAIAWICRKQLGRRNLTPEQRKYLLGKRYEAEKASHGGLRNKHRDVTGQFTTSSQNGNLWSNENTAEQIAEENNVGKNSVIRAEKYAKGVDAAEEVLPGIKQEILSGSIKPTQASVAAVGGQTRKRGLSLLSSSGSQKSNRKNQSPGKRLKIQSLMMRKTWTNIKDPQKTMRNRQGLPSGPMMNWIWTMKIPT